METCVCSALRSLAANYDEGRAKGMIAALNCHLKELRALLAQSKSLTRDVPYRITLNNQRTMKALFISSLDLTPINRVYERFRDDIDGFWTHSDDAVHVELRRRLACVAILLRSKLDAEVLVPPGLARLLHGQSNYADLRNSGRKYIKIARKLGGLGSLLWLPLDIPPSTYERYLNMDDEEVFGHLNSLRPTAEHYANFVQRVILSQLQDSSPSCSYYNLFVEYGEVIPASDQLLLLLHALGGSDVPEILFTSARFPQRRWNAEGEIESTSAGNYGLPSELVNLLSDDLGLAQATASPLITRSVLEGGTIAWSLKSELSSFLSQALLPQTVDALGITALKLICFACPPCYEGNTHWSASLKKSVWPLLENTAKRHPVHASLKPQVLEAILYFCERDSISIRRIAVEQMKLFLRKSMPYYLHASAVLFHSILHRVDGELAKSEAQIRDFLWRGPQPVTRRDHALRGRLHISQIENKIKCYDDDVPSFIYKWEAEQPLSSLDIEVTSRLQTAAARYFQSIGEFSSAGASLEQFLSLNASNPIRVNTRRLVVGRLADIYCEMKEYSKAVEILQPELDGTGKPDRPRRPYRRLLLASVEANAGIGRLDVVESALEELEGLVISVELDDLFDQQLHMRRLLAVARTAHMRRDHDMAVLRWKFALQEVERMHTLKGKSGFTAAVIHLSMAHAQLATGDRDGAQHSWAAGVEILRLEKCEFWIPILPTVWLQRIATDVHEMQGWSLRLMLPGGKPDVTWP